MQIQAKLVVFCVITVKNWVFIIWIWNWVMNIGTGSWYPFLATNCNAKSNKGATHSTTGLGGVSLVKWYITGVVSEV